MTETYYDQLTPYYKYVYQDWEASIKHQAEILNNVIKEYFGQQVCNIRDVACGIGTQSIGLSKLGYRIEASDISPVEIDQAKKEASKRGLEIEFNVADMRDLHSQCKRQYDVIIACDNAIPHLLNDADILSTFKGFYNCIAPNGGCMISVRDYANMERGGTRFFPRKVHITNDNRIVIFDLWQFDGDYYDITTYIIDDRSNEPAKTVISSGGRYYCITIDKLNQLLRSAGFSRVEILTDIYFQPLLVGIKN